MFYIQYNVCNNERNFLESTQKVNPKTLAFKSFVKDPKNRISSTMGFWDICPEMHMNLEGLLKTDLPRSLR